MALLFAVVCVAADRFFGVTSGWMRDVATAQAVQRRLQAFQFDWASECVREVLGPTEGTASEATERCLSVLRRFWEDVSEVVRVETTDWMMEFRTATKCRRASRGRRRARAAPSRPDSPTAASRPCLGPPARTCPGSGRRSRGAVLPGAPGLRVGVGAEALDSWTVTREVAMGADHALADGARQVHQEARRQ
ncbi:hypothetical protein SHIRM173S_07669 [Streptomyces hirsutus]